MAGSGTKTPADSEVYAQARAKTGPKIGQKWSFLAIFDIFGQNPRPSASCLTSLHWVGDFGHFCQKWPFLAKNEPFLTRVWAARVLLAPLLAPKRGQKWGQKWANFGAKILLLLH